MANTNAPYGLQFYTSIAGAAVVTARKRTLSNVTLKPGDPVVRTGGYIKLAGATSTGIFGVSVEAVVGVAGTRNSALIMPAAKEYVWKVQSKSTTNITQGTLQNKGCVAGSTSGKFGIGCGAAAKTTSVLQIIGLAPDSALGTYAQLLVVIAKSTYAP